MDTQELRKYELMVIVSGEMPEAQLEKEKEELKKLLKENVKSITHEDVWGLKNFAYRFKKQARGYYVVFNFEAVPSAVLELRSNIRLNQAVLRHMLITVPDEYVPGHHEDVVFFRDEQKAEAAANAKRPRVKTKEMKQLEKEMSAPKTGMAGKKEEEELKTVEKKLEKILENPDFDIK